jgi:hypothetical protein
MVQRVQAAVALEDDTAAVRGDKGVMFRARNTKRVRVSATYDKVDFPNFVEVEWDERDGESVITKSRQCVIDPILRLERGDEIIVEFPHGQDGAVVMLGFIRCANAAGWFSGAEVAET